MQRSDSAQSSHWRSFMHTHLELVQWGSIPLQKSLLFGMED